MGSSGDTTWVSWSVQREVADAAFLVLEGLQMPSAQVALTVWHGRLQELINIDSVVESHLAANTTESDLGLSGTQG